MSPGSGGWANPLRFEADDLALFLAEADVVRSATEALDLDFGRALEMRVRVERRHQERAS